MTSNVTPTPLTANVRDVPLNKKYYTVREAAAVLELPICQVYGLIRRSEIDSENYGRHLISWSAIQDFYDRETGNTLRENWWPGEVPTLRRAFWRS